MSIRKMVLVPYDQYINSIKQNIEIGNANPIGSLGKNSESENTVSTEDRSEKNKLKRSHIKEQNSAGKKTKLVSPQLKGESKKSVSNTDIQLKLRPPPGIPDQTGSGALKKADLFNFDSPVGSEKKKSLVNIQDLIKKHWTE